MNRKSPYGLLALLLLALFLLTSPVAHWRPTDSSIKTIRFKALIDGTDTVKIRGGKIWYEHESWELPGKSHGSNEPTIINGKKWYPGWKSNKGYTGFTIAGWEIRRIGSDHNRSTVFAGLNPAFNPQLPMEIHLTKIAGRGPVTISQMPGPKNNYTLALHFDDGSFGGADWYEVTIDWK